MPSDSSSRWNPSNFKLQLAMRIQAVAKSDALPDVGEYGVLYVTPQGNYYIYLDGGYFCIADQLVLSTAHDGCIFCKDLPTNIPLIQLEDVSSCSNSTNNTNLSWEKAILGGIE